MHQRPVPIRPTRRGVAAVLLAMAFAALPSVLPAVDVGNHGTTLDLEQLWRHKEMNPDLGPDQFILPHAARCCAVIETELSVVDLAGADLVFRDRLLGGPLEEGYRVSKVDFSRRGELVHARYAATQRINGLHLHFSLNLISKDGLSYWVMLWAPAAKSGEVDTMARSLPDRFSFPGPGTDWQALSEPAETRVAVQGFEVRVSVPPISLLPMHGDALGDALLGYSDRSGSFEAYLLDTVGNESLDQSLEGAREMVLEGEDGYVASSPVDLEVGGKAARRMLCEPEDSHPGSLRMELIAIRLEDDHHLDLRIFHYGEPAAWAHLRDLLLDNLVIESLDDPSALPPLDEEAGKAGTDQALGSPVAGLVEEGEAAALADLPEKVTLALAGGFYVVRDRVVRATDGEVEEIRRFESPHWSRAAARLGDRWLTIEDETLVDADGEVLDLGVNRVVAIGHDREGRCYVVANASGTEQGEDAVPTPFPDDRHRLAIFRVTPDGGEVVELPWRSRAYNPQAFAVGGDGTCAVAHYRWDDAWDPDDRFELRLELVLPDGAVRKGSVWSQVDLIVPRAGGFLVSGRPEGSLRGVYLVDPANAGDSHRALLIGDTCRGLRWDEREGLDVGCPEWKDGAFRELRFRIPSDALPVGAAPAQVADLIAAATELDSVSAGDPPHRRDLAWWRSHAAALERAVAPRLLPEDLEGVDRLIFSFFDRPVDPDVRIALLALAIDRMVESGAEWVPAGEDASAAARSPVAGLFSVPVSIVRSVDVMLLDDDAGGLGWAVESANGRRLLIGPDPAALRVRAREFWDTELVATIEQGDAEAAASALTERHPDNRHLREAIYGRWLQAGRSAEVATVVRAIAEAGRAGPRDRLAGFLATVRADRKSTDWVALVEELREFIAANPDEIHAFLCLARAYEKVEGPISAKARFLYNEVARRQTYGGLAEVATEGIERIDAARAARAGRDDREVDAEPVTLP